MTSTAGKCEENGINWIRFITMKKESKREWMNE